MALQTTITRRTIPFEGAGRLAPSSLYFTNDRRLLASPGCYTFEAK